jgi:hypothetical protein
VQGPGGNDVGEEKDRVRNRWLPPAAVKEGAAVREMNELEAATKN